MDRHRVDVILFSHLFDGPDLNDACIVDEHIDTMETPFHRFDGAAGLFRIANVARNGVNFDAAALQLICGRGKLVFLAREERQLCSLGRKPPRDFQSEAARCSRYQHDSVSERDASTLANNATCRDSSCCSGCDASEDSACE